MPNDSAVRIATHEESDERELKLLEEVVRQAEVRLSALAQTRQMVAAKATSVMTWALTVFIALTAALAASSGTERLVSARSVLLTLWFGSLLAVTCSPIAVLINLWSKRLRDGWQHAGSNPRFFINEMPPKEEKRSPMQKALGRLLRRANAGETLPGPQVAALSQTKAKALRDTAARYTRAIDENEQILAETVNNVAIPLSVMLVAALFIAVGLAIYGLFGGTQHINNRQPPSTTSLAPSSVPSLTTPGALEPQGR